MTTRLQEPVTQANHRLIAQVSVYYNDAKKNIEFYKEINSIRLQEMSQKHLQYWKSELRSLIFNGLNCTDKRNA